MPMNARVGGGGPRIGISYSEYVRSLVDDERDAFAYVEVPFELLRQNPRVLPIEHCGEILLHCASLSMAGEVRPDERTWDAVAAAIERTGTPWLTEHMAFYTAARTPGDGHSAVPIYDIGYAISAPMNEESLARVVGAVDECVRRLGLRVALENSPLYFVPPGSTMSQTEFLRRVCEESEAWLLLDLPHFVITSRNAGVEPLEALGELPLDRVLEVHVSGISHQDGADWDDHTVTTPQIVLDLLGETVRRSSVEAVTLEYSWNALFPRETLLGELARVRQAIAA